MITVRTLFILGVIAVVIPSTSPAQSVVSTRSGVINFFEGTAYLDDRPLESHAGHLVMMSLGAELRTTEGRAEVLLTPGVFIRLDHGSSVRMLANKLADTQVELRTGSVIVDSAEPSSGTSVTLIYKDWFIHFLQKGTYRIDANSPRLEVTRGYAEVLVGADGEPLSVEAGHALAFSEVLAPELSTDASADGLLDWSNGRSQSISADDAITEHIGEDVPLHSSSLDSFTYFPFIGVPVLGLGNLSPYALGSLFQPGFNSIYLPGYRYQPLYSLVPWGNRFQIFMPPRPPQTGISPARPSPPTPGPHPPFTHPAPIHSPVRSGVRPIH
jgi:hypothetical protein